jgi:hypothetical protein
MENIRNFLKILALVFLFKNLVTDLMQWNSVNLADYIVSVAISLAVFMLLRKNKLNEVI